MWAGSLKKALVILIVIFCMIIPYAFADEVTIISSGTCGANGDNVTWTLDEKGTLTISGEGGIDGFSFHGDSFELQFQTLVIEEAITSIGTAAFADCDSLTKLYLPESLETIEDHAFAGCSNLENFIIPDNVTSVGDYAFYGCHALTEVTIPERITTISNYTFYNCLNIETFFLHDGITFIGDNALWTMGNYNTNIFCTAGSSTANQLRYYNFIDVNSPEFILHQNVDDVGSVYLTIEEYIGNATAVILPSVISGVPVVEIGDNAFSDQSSLTAITIPESIVSIGSYAFSSCTSIANMEMPDSIISVGGYVFYDCFGMMNISLSNNLASIGEGMFYGCSNLSEIEIPESVTAIGSYAFYKCCFQSIEIPDGVITIGDYAFSDCKSISDIILPESVTSLGSGAFYFCESLVKINLPANITVIGDSAFWGCNKLNSLSIPEGVTTIENGTFAYCHNLYAVTLPETLMQIGERAFDCCCRLTSITIPDCVTAIETEAFSSCNELRKVLFTGMDMPILGNKVFSSDPTIYCIEYSDVDFWAIGNAYDIVYIDNMDLNSPISLSLPDDCMLGIGVSKVIVPDVFPQQVVAEISWSSSSPGVVSVGDGIITAHEIGEAIITATCGDLSASMVITTYPGIYSFTLSDSELYLVTKTTAEITIGNIAPENAWSNFALSYGGDVFEIADWNGDIITIKGRKPGEEILIVEDSLSGLYRECIIHVCYPVTAIEFSSVRDTAYVGEEKMLTANVTANTEVFTNKLVSFTSSDESIATIDMDGTLTAHNPGTVTITATADSGVKAGCKITVKSLNVFTLPESVIRIEAEAFAHTAVNKVVVSSNCEAIGSRAFADNEDLLFVYMPDNVTYIEDDAFEGCSNVCFICESANTAAEYAAEHGIAFTIE